MAIQNSKIIFYIGNFTQHSTETYIRRAFEELGYKVKTYPRTVYLETLSADLFNYKPCLLLFGKINSMPDGFQWTIMDFKGFNVPVVSWTFDLFWDLPHGIQRAPSTIIKYCSHVFTTDGGHLEKWKKAKVNHFLLRQGIYEPEHKIIESEKDIDVLFVGSRYYKYREQLYDFLDSNYDLTWVGHDEQVRGLDLNKLLGRSKVVVGDSAPWPYYWSNRLYEITGRGGFLIHPYTDGILDEFPDLVTYEYNNFDDLKKKIDYYLVHDTAREANKLLNFKKCGEYTYLNRVKRFCGIVKI